MISTIGAIAAGGAIGAVMRHLVNTGLSSYLESPFPWGTLVVNVLGCFIMGVMVALFAGSWNPPQDLRAFLTVGILGGFTTFSAFSLDTMSLWTQGNAAAAFSYVMASVVFSICAVFLGSWIAWKALS